MPRRASGASCPAPVPECKFSWRIFSGFAALGSTGGITDQTGGIVKAHYYLLALVAACPAAFGTTVVSQLFSAGSTGSFNELSAISWTQTGSYSSVDILANIANTSSIATTTATAYLMTQIGAGTTAADEVVGPVTASVTGNPGLNAMTTIFSGLTLGPGTYYLVLDPNSTDFHWDLTIPPVVATDSGVTAGPSVATNTVAGFPPASTFGSESFSFIYEVTGTAGTGTSTPEPSTAVMLIIGVAAIAAWRKRTIC
jgi:hypothetical protein